MPDKIIKQGNKYRLMHDTVKGLRIVKTKRGNAVDGGGHRSKAAAERQVSARNAGRHGWHKTRRTRQ